MAWETRESENTRVALLFEDERAARAVQIYLRKTEAGRVVIIPPLVCCFLCPFLCISHSSSFGDIWDVAERIASLRRMALQTIMIEDGNIKARQLP